MSRTFICSGVEKECLTVLDCPWAHYKDIKECYKMDVLNGTCLYDNDKKIHQEELCPVTIKCDCCNNIVLEKGKKYKKDMPFFER